MPATNEPREDGLRAIQCLAFVPETIELSDADGETLDKAARKNLLRDVRQGEPVELVLQAVTFRQSKTPRPLPASKAREANANFTVFEPAQLNSLAKSFRRRQFLRDHNRFQLAAVGGIIEKSELADAGDFLEFHQAIRLQAAWAVEAALDGTLRTFSIGARFKARTWSEVRKSIMCSVCNCAFFSGDCPHALGETVKHDETGERLIVEALLRNMAGDETSGVSFPAVQGTGIEGIAALMESKLTTEIEDMKQIAKHLGLSADADEGEILGALKQREKAATDLSQELEQTKTTLAAKEQALAGVEAQLIDAQAALSASSDAARQKTEDDLVARALNEGRMRPGEEAIEKGIRSLAATDMDAARELVDGLPKRDPIGPELQTKPVHKNSSANKFGLTPRQLNYCRQMGVSPERYRELLDQEQELAG